jgi:hypothetical protein
MEASRPNIPLCYRYAQGAPNDFEPNRGAGHKRKWPKVGPNNSCPCASGKKFKKCCRDYKTLVAKITEQQRVAAAIPE